MKDITILHHPRCSKSRQTLQLLKDRDYDPVIVEYLKTPLSAEALQAIKIKLGVSSFKDMMRIKEAEFKQLALNADGITETQLLDAMVACPKLIERPIVITEMHAKIGRPPEQVLEIL